MFETKEGKVDCCLPPLKCFADERGELSFAEGLKEIPFRIARIFWIKNVPEGEERGGHAHWKCAEAIFPLTGGFDIYIDDGFVHHTFKMTKPEEGILVKPGVWCVLRNFKPGTVCLVAASMEYDAEGYVNDYQTFLKEVRCK
jgi:hypothetical protein